MSAASLLQLLLTFKYGALFILVIIEGFFSTIAAGALSAQHLMNVVIACVIVIAADMTGDFLYYTFGKKISKTRFAKFLGLAPGQIHRVERVFTRLGPSAIILAKLSSYLAIPVIVAAGALHMPKPRFYSYCLVAAAIKAVVLLFIGYYFGKEIHNAVHAVVIASIAISGAVLMYWIGSHLLRTAALKRSSSPAS